jgi:general secretion pathway protein A
MYLDHFHLSKPPFSLTPDPGFLLLGEDHREALAHLLYGISESGGFVQLTGEVGTGKTTLCYYLLNQIPDSIDVALILNPRQSALELVASICDELGIDTPTDTISIKPLLDRLNRYLIASHGNGRKTVLIIDEAQNLDPEVLEQVRLLTNLETPTSKLLQILLIGQPELKKIMARSDLRQLDQRITARYHLTPLSREETVAYIKHRMAISGSRRQPFTEAAMRAVHELSRGVPRVINIICDRSLLGAYSLTVDTIDPKIVKTAYGEIRGKKDRRRSMKTYAGFAAALILLALGIGAGLMKQPELRALVAPGPSKPTAMDDATSWKASRPDADPTDGMPGLPDDLSSEETALSIADRQYRSNRIIGLPPSGGTEVAEITDPTDAKNLPPEIAPLLADLATLLREGEASSRDLHAFDTLLNLWHEDTESIPKASNGCIRALAAGLQCVDAIGTLDDVRSYNRPAILELSAPGQAAHHVVLVKVTGGGYVIDAGGVRGEITAADLLTYWTGRFTVLWRPPPLTRTPLSQGMKGTDVLWLRTQLAMASPLASATPEWVRNPVFDPDLTQRVIDFQKARHLNADGVVGQRTLIELNNAVADPRVPRLLETPMPERRG